MSTKKWEELTLDEKLTELGFVKGDRPDKGEYPNDETRMHAALDQLLDTGETLNTIEEMCEGAGTGKPTGDELNFCAEIYTMLHGAEDTEGEDN